MRVNNDHLTKEAELGKLPFDVFALEKWDYTQPIEQDQEQWNRLIQEWLDLDARGRHPYHYDGERRPRVAKATVDQMNRVLAPHQAIHERNISDEAGSGHLSPIWLRTCYDSELASVHDKWIYDLEDSMGHWALILDDEALYAPFAADWSSVLYRVPAIADSVRYIFEDDGNLYDRAKFYDPPGKGEEYKIPWYEAMIKETTMLLLIDEEALREKLVKLLWLDIHGNCIWDNRLRADRMLEFRGKMFAIGGSLDALYENFPDDPKVYERGFILDID